MTRSLHIPRSPAMSRAGIIFITVAMLACLAPGSARAYVDPGAGSAIMQMVVGIAALVLVSARSVWRTVTGGFRRTKGRRSGGKS